MAENGKGLNMERENICVFCGERLGGFRHLSITCAGVEQPCCKNCSKELKELDREECCRRALRLGYAFQKDKLEEIVNIAGEAEEHRPACLRCGAKMIFEPEQYFDNSPFIDSVLLTSGFEILPTHCESCGRYEFYKPDIVNKNKFFAYLIEKDTADK